MSDMNERLRDRIASIKESVRLQSYVVFCSTHGEAEANFYCPYHQTLICEACIHSTNHGPHSSEIVAVQANDLDFFCTKAIGKLLSLSDRILRLVDSLKEFKLKERAYTSEFFI